MGHPGSGELPESSSFDAPHPVGQLWWVGGHWLGPWYLQAGSQGLKRGGHLCLSSGAETATWRERQQREKEEWVELCLQGWGLVWVFVGGSDPKR